MIDMSDTHLHSDGAKGRNGRYFTIALAAVAIVLIVASLLVHVYPAAAQSQSISFSGSSYVAPPTCALYGASDYTNSWLSINFLVVIVGLLITSIVYVLSKLLPRSVSSRVSEMSKTEISQLFLSIIIILVLLSFTTFACSTVSNLSTKLTGQSMDPFTYADYYVGNLTFNTGLSLLSQVYSDSVSLSLSSRIITAIGEYVADSGGKIVQKLQSLALSTSGKLVTISPDFDPSIPLALLADEYLIVFSTLLITSLGTLMLQYILIPFIRYTAFTVLLPVALVLRSIAYAGYGGNGLRSAANVFIAIAIAAYLIYPLTIAFDSYVIHWIFTPCTSSSLASCNPNYQYIGSSYNLLSISPSSYFGGISSYASGSVNSSVSVPTSLSSPLSPLYLYTQLAGFKSITIIFTAPYTTLSLVKTMSQYIFTAIMLFALNFAVTIGFAMSFTKALNNGIVGASSFWGSI